jgi:hypothetical protein
MGPHNTYKISFISKEIMVTARDVTESVLK